MMPGEEWTISSSAEQYAGAIMTNETTGRKYVVISVAGATMTVKPYRWWERARDWVVAKWHALFGDGK
jgi:hypothetical protein